MGVLLEGVLSYHVLLVWLESVDGGLVHGIVSLPVGLRQRSSFMELLSFLMVKMH